MTDERLNRRHRNIIKRIIVRGNLVLDTPTCLGNGDSDGPIDLMLLRDSISEHALLTGASMAGALRNYLHEYQNNYEKEEKPDSLATFLFGAIRSDDNGEQSPLLIQDSISTKQPDVELRDGVKINGKNGTAAKKAKYELELLAAGTEFPLYFELLVEQEKDEATLIKALVLALRGLENAEIGIGIKKRRGFGRCNVTDWQVWQFNLTDNAERLAWLTFDHTSTQLSATHETYESIAAAFGLIPEDLNKQDRRDRFSIHATFKLASPLLIRSGQNSTESAPDVVHLRSHRQNQLEPVLSGTSLAGVLWHRAERIANTLGRNMAIIDNLFGFVDKNTKQAKASRLVINESVIKNWVDLVQTRIAIDRFTGGTYHGALFDEQPIFGSDETRLTLELELRHPSDAEIGLLLLLLKDLWTSDLPIGAESSIGRGRLQGINAVMLRLTPENPQESWTISQDGEQLKVSDASALENFVAVFVSDSSGEVAA